MVAARRTKLAGQASFADLARSRSNTRDYAVSSQLRFPTPNGQPRLGFSQPGLLCSFGKRTCKPNSVVCGHSSRRRVAAVTHQRPTRRFRHVLEPPCRIGPMRSRAWLYSAGFPPYLVLLRVGFTLPPASQPERCALTAPFHPYPSGTGRTGEPVGPFRKSLRRGVAEAVSFLWHWPSTDFEVRVPDVIRHTALRSSDFPPPATRFPRPPAATARSSCQGLVYREKRFCPGPKPPAGDAFPATKPWPSTDLNRRKRSHHLLV